MIIFIFHFLIFNVLFYLGGFGPLYFKVRKKLAIWKMGLINVKYTLFVNQWSKHAKTLMLELLKLLWCHFLP